MKNYNLLLAFLIIFLAGCSSNSKLATPSPTNQSTPLFTRQPTIFPIEIQAATITPSQILSHSISTPSKKDNSEITLELLRINNGCNLPCWWGIIPNQTKWSDANDFMKLFSNISERQPPNEWFVYDVSSPISKDFSEFGKVESVFAVQQELVKEIEISGFNEKTYYLSSVLQKYGVPTRVLISTYSSDYGLPSNQVPLSIDLYYPDKGINVLYGAYATVKGGQISGCLENPHIFVWSPNEHARSIDYILGWDKNHTPYMSIEKAVNLDIQSFYEKYKNPQNPPCLQTPVNLWPSQ